MQCQYLLSLLSYTKKPYSSGIKVHLWFDRYLTHAAYFHMVELHTYFLSSSVSVCVCVYNHWQLLLFTFSGIKIYTFPQQQKSCFKCVCLCVCLYMSVCMHMCVLVCMCVHACMCVCVLVCVCWGEGRVKGSFADRLEWSWAPVSYRLYVLAHWVF